MPTIQTRDRTTLFYKDWGTGPTIVLAASANMPSDIWAYNLPPLVEAGFRCVALDRRGHGRSDQPSGGYDLDTLADDLATLVTQLELRDVTLVGHSFGGAEVVRYLSRHGRGAVARVVLMGATLPCLLQKDDNPHGFPAAAHEGLRQLQRRDLAKWVKENTPPFFTPDTSPERMQWGSALMLQCQLKVLLDLSRTMESADLRPELAALALPTLVIHGDQDASVPLALGRETARLVRNSRLSVHEGAAHGVFITHADRVNQELVTFAREDG